VKLEMDRWARPRSNESPHEPSFKISARQLAVIVLFVSLSVLFIASIVAYLITRAQSPVWRSAASPGLPLGLLGSTALLIGVSVSAQRALTAVRDNRLATLIRSLWLTLIFAIAFVSGQLLNWTAMWHSAVSADSRTLYVVTFFMLTGLHALHVLGGLIPLLIVLGRARRRQYSSSQHEGVAFCAQYWHFLGVVWLLLLVTLVLGS
jgi:cytochrome c oxidase subunit 3